MSGQRNASGTSARRRGRVAPEPSRPFETQDQSQGHLLGLSRCFPGRWWSGHTCLVACVPFEKSSLKSRWAWPRSQMLCRSLRRAPRGICCVTAHPSSGPFGAVLSDVPLRPQVTGRASDSGHLLLTLEHCGVRGTHPLHRHLQISLLTPPAPRGLLVTGNLTHPRKHGWHYTCSLLCSYHKAGWREKS